MRTRFMVVVLAFCACSTEGGVPVPPPPFNPPLAPDGSTGCADTAHDPLNCGTCGRVCHGTPCDLGMCASIVIAQGEWTPNLVVVKDGYVYWTAAGGKASVMRAPVSGTSVEELASGEDAWGLAVDATTVYYTTQNVGGGGAVRSVPKTGGTPTTLAIDKNTPMELALADDTLYWTQAAPNGDGAVMAMSTHGAATRLSAVVSPTRYATSMAVGPTSVWVTWSGYASAESTVSYVARDGGAETIFTSGQLNPQSVVLDGQVLFWGEVGPMFDRGVLHAAWTDGTNTQTMTTSEDTINRIAVDADEVYWTYWPGQAKGATGNNGGVRVMSRGGAAKVLELARGEASPSGIAVDDTAIYWAVQGNNSLSTRLGQIKKLPKP